jgi:hypothetical protein
MFAGRLLAHSKSSLLLGKTGADWRDIRRTVKSIDRFKAPVTSVAAAIGTTPTFRNVSFYVGGFGVERTP